VTFASIILVMGRGSAPAVPHAQLSVSVNDTQKNSRAVRAKPFPPTLGRRSPKVEETHPAHLAHACERPELAEQTASLCQNPHSLRSTGESRLQTAIGREVRFCRKRHGMTLAELAEAAGVSLGMMSKIENGHISPSLATLQALAKALAVPLSSLLRRFEQGRNAVFVKSGMGVEVGRRGTRAGHQYNLLGYIGHNTGGISVEPYLITLTRDTDTFPLFQHAGIELLYLLEGELTYRHGTSIYRLMPGDSLFFDADAPHGPDELIKLPIRLLSVISYGKGGVED
jgi:transcriptional regulator with XRE-family HTH domain